MIIKHISTARINLQTDSLFKRNEYNKQGQIC